jgi:hypothetical protein
VPTASLASDSNPFLEFQQRRARARLFWLSALVVVFAVLAIVYLLKPALLGL